LGIGITTKDIKEATTVRGAMAVTEAMELMGASRHYGGLVPSSNWNGVIS
jgi:hypothetical protein